MTIDSEGQRAVITERHVVTIIPASSVDPDWSPTVDSDREASARMRAKLFAQWADEDILVIGTHYAAPTRRTGRKRDGSAYRFDA